MITKRVVTLEKTKIIKRNILGGLAYLKIADDANAIIRWLSLGNTTLEVKKDLKKYLTEWLNIF